MSDSTSTKMSSIEAQSPIYPVLTQPGSRLGPPPGAFPENGVTVRVLRDTQTDAEFAAKLTVEAFRGKFVHTITERKLPILMKQLTANHRGQNRSFYNRTFIAEIDGQPVGLLQLKFKGDSEIEKEDHLSDLGCWHGCRYGCFGIVTSVHVDESFKCYVDHICVDESARGRGVGKLLMQRADFEARNRNCSLMYLHVTVTNRAKNLYEREGFHVMKTTGKCSCLGCCIGPPGKVHEMEKSL